MGSLYRKYRSRSLDEIVGQEHITGLLARAVAAGTISHAYLLSGPHGVGKTSIARILAHEINHLPYDDDSTHLDIIEIDAASNNGVEDIRELRERVRIAPGSAEKKIYIIDEVHMLSKSAFNALLKTLEEPPEHVVFILATTEPDKLPSTIISRVQRFNFRSISQDAVVQHLHSIAEQESIAIDEAALIRIAEHGQGSFRDSISVLDQLRHAASGKTVTTDDVENVLGITSDETISSLLDATRREELDRLVKLLHELETSGISASQVARQLTTRIQASITAHPEELPLLDQLLDVPSSAYPYVKLLTVLARRSASASSSPPPRPSQAEGSAFPGEAETSKEAASGPDVPEGSDGSGTEREVKPQTTRQAPASLEKSGEANTNLPKNATASETKRAPTPLIANFSWPDFLTSAKEKSGALHALLTKSGAEFSDDILTIYAGNAFAVKKLESAKLRPILSDIAESQGIDGDKIAIKADKKPPTDSEAAAIAAIMGGGEEVSINGN